MECNRDEAIRVKDLAEKKMENKDFVTAQRLAVKAQKLYPNLENISQMILVCDVFCSAEKIVYANEKDWYGILHIDPTADEVSIKKQYRKLALSLHPDKNKFSGAADAFKLITEAQRFLLDQEKRTLYDTKLKAAMSVKGPSVVQSNQDPRVVNHQTTFWTACPGCCVRYQYFKEVIDKIVMCQNCKRYYAAKEANTHQPGLSESPTKKNSRIGSQGSNSKSKNVVDKKKPSNGVKDFKSNEESKNGDESSKFVEPNCKNDKKRKKNVVESGESSAKAEKRRKKKVVESGESSAKAEKNEVNNSSVDVKVNEKQVKKDKKDKGNSSVSSEVYQYPDTEFNNFESERKEERFVAGQIWAIYDNLDAMPRYYALISKVFSPGFKLRLTWLEADPDNEEENKWVENSMPVSCGKFKRLKGGIENTQDHPMFSHLVYWGKGKKANTYVIYPRKGETWALFKNWDINWHSDPEVKKKKFEYEFVEILFDYVDGVGVHVWFLAKTKGFACVFHRKSNKEASDTALISEKEKFRFSHKIPSFRLTGNERENVPEYSFELDPACLPTNITESLPNCSSSVQVEEVSSEHEVKTDNVMEDVSETSDSAGKGMEIPDQEFYNFDLDKSPEKFEVGQIWAIYSDEDALPKYYGKIQKISRNPEFKLHVKWLEACFPAKDTITYVNKEIPLCCGHFRIMKGKAHQSDTEPFSHLVNAYPSEKKDVYEILPRKGEVWALYRNWHTGMRLKDLKDCKYDIVEVVEEMRSGFKVMVLQPFENSKSVYGALKIGGLNVTVEIVHAEVLRFSHQVPCFRLTEEKGGKLKGCVELNTAALVVADSSSG